MTVVAVASEAMHSEPRRGEARWARSGRGRTVVVVGVTGWSPRLGVAHLGRVGVGPGHEKHANVMTSVQKEPLGGSGYSGYPPGTGTGYA